MSVTKEDLRNGFYFYHRPGWAEKVLVWVQEMGSGYFVHFNNKLIPHRLYDIPFDAIFEDALPFEFWVDGKELKLLMNGIESLIGHSPIRNPDAEALVIKIDSLIGTKIPPLPPLPSTGRFQLLHCVSGSLQKVERANTERGIFRLAYKRAHRIEFNYGTDSLHFLLIDESGQVFIYDIGDNQMLDDGCAVPECEAAAVKNSEHEKCRYHDLAEQLANGESISAKDLEEAYRKNEEL